MAERHASVYGSESFESASEAGLTASQVCHHRICNRGSAAVVAASDEDSSLAAVTSTSTTLATSASQTSTSSPLLSFPARCSSSRLVASSIAFLSALSHAPEALAATAAAARTAAAAAATSAAVAVAAAAPAVVGSVAEGGPLPPALLEALSSFLAAVEDMGPAGAGVFAATVALAELVPLLPTTPLALASGLLFGAAKGALLVLAGNLAAATLAFYISRGIGARFAKRMVAAEGGHHDGGGGGEGGGGGSSSGRTKGAAKGAPAAAAAAASGLAARFASVTAAIEAGTPAQKFAAVFALRATPVVPFSASNYVLGLSPIGFPVYITATALGGSVWASVYASLGAASRALLARGASFDVLVADLLEQAASVADDAATGLVLLSLGAAAGWGLALAARASKDEGEEGAGTGEVEGIQGGGAATGDPEATRAGKDKDGGDGRALEVLQE